MKERKEELAQQQFFSTRLSPAFVKMIAAAAEASVSATATKKLRYDF